MFHQIRMLWKIIRQTVRIIRTRIRRITTDKLYLRKVTIPKFSLGYHRLLKLRQYFTTIFSFSLHPKYYKNAIRLLRPRPEINPRDIPENIILVYDSRRLPYPRYFNNFDWPFDRLPLPTIPYFDLRYRPYYTLEDIYYQSSPRYQRRQQA